MHGKLRWIVHGQPIMHQTKDTLLVLSTVPRSKNNCRFLFDIKYYGGIRMQSQLLPIFDYLTAGINDSKVRFKSFQLLMAFGSDKHVSNEMLLPRNLMDESNLFLSTRVGTAKSIKHVGFVQRVEVRHGAVEQCLVNLGRGGLVHLSPIQVFIRLASRVFNHKLIVGRTTSEFACIDGEGISVFGIGDAALLVFDFVIVEFLKGEVAVYSRWIGDANGVDSGLGRSVGPFNNFGDIVGVSAFCVGGLISELLVLW
mmetsp:Transcript_46601/g.68871  ORF Transcript_46601/g.68871 Transcript_46601/m.68871 type:complete len:255 (+) Transcript_46601:1028-1792(+)